MGAGGGGIGGAEQLGAAGGGGVGLGGPISFLLKKSKILGGGGAAAPGGGGGQGGGGAAGFGLGPSVIFSGGMGGGFAAACAKLSLRLSSFWPATSMNEELTSTTTQRFANSRKAFVPRKTPIFPWLCLLPYLLQFTYLHKPCHANPLYIAL